MAKVTRKKRTRSAHQPGSKKTLKVAQPRKPRSAATVSGESLTFNHAMVYCKDVERALGFLVSDGVRLYFEIRELEDFCRKLQAKGFYITQMPRMMPWGWRHAYLNDPDGHEISLYWASESRMNKTVMRTAKQIEDQK